jgi:hypothetical protein
MLGIAGRATPGPLEVRLGSGNNACTALASAHPDHFDQFFADFLPDYACKPGIALRWEANRDFAATFDPSTCAELIREVVRLREQVEDSKMRPLQRSED